MKTAWKMIASVMAASMFAATLIAAPIPRMTKVFTYHDMCGCYVLTYDSHENDGCEIFVNGDHVFDNGRC